MLGQGGNKAVRKFVPAYRLEKGMAIWFPRYGKDGKVAAVIMRYVRSDAEMVGVSSKRKRMQVVLDIIDEPYLMIDSDHHFELV